MKPLSECQLYAFVDTAYLHGRAPEEVARQLCQGGADLIQLRAKGSNIDEITRMSEQLLAVTREHNVNLVINDHLKIAQKIGADFCHLGQEDFFEAGFSHVSDIVSGNCKLGIGLSTHAPEQANRSIASGANYIAIGPVYPTGTKPNAKPVTLEYVRWAAEHLRIPWFAIGGINLQNLQEVLAAGASRICVVSAILNSDNVAKTCRVFKERVAGFVAKSDPDKPHLLPH